MKKTIISLLLILALVLSLGLSVYADETNPDASIEGGTALFDGKTITGNYSSETLAGAAGALQPGDDAKITIYVKNAHTESADWWLKNEILKNFLASEVGGAYSYKLSFTDAVGNKTEIYSSERVGGTGTTADGLKDVNSTLKDYVFLGTIPAGKSGKLVLYIKLEGETQSNAYQDQLASLKLNFAVELTKDRIVRTGDDTDPMPYLTASAISGVVLLVLAIVSMEKNRKKQGGQAR